MAEYRIDDREIEQILAFMDLLDDTEKEMAKRQPPDKANADIRKASDGVRNVLNEVKSANLE
jgi:hypothetical protein